jgi:hypothetical protein
MSLRSILITQLARRSTPAKPAAATGSAATTGHFFQTQAAQNMKLLCRMLGNSSRHSRRRRRMTRAKERLLITASGRNEFTERLGSMTGAACAVA